MKYCEKCGNTIKENNKFCEKCGTPVPASQVQEEGTEKAEMPQATKEAKAPKAPPKPKKVVDEKTKKMRKIIGIAAAIVLILGFAGYKVGESLTNRDKIIDQFITAISEKNTAELAKLVKSSDRRLEFTEENLKPFLSYIDENPSYFDRLEDSLKDQSMKIRTPDRNDENRAMTVFSEEDNSSKSMIFLRKNGKKYLLYDNYEIVMQPFYINIKTNHRDVSIYINDEELDKSTTDDYFREFGPFAPGKYELKGIYQGEYTTVEEKQDMGLVLNNTGEMHNILHYDLNMAMRYIHLDTNYQDANIIVNGKDIGLRVEDILNTGLGPVGDSTTIQLSREFPWGTIATEEESVEYSNDYMGLYFNPANEDLEEDIMKAVNTFLHDDIEALTARDVSKYTNTIDPLRNDRSMKIDNLIEWEEMHKAVLKRAVYDLNSLTIEEGYNEYYASIRCETNLERSYYYEGSEPEELGEVNDNYKYYLSYDLVEKEWVVYQVIKEYYWDDSNTKTFDFEK